MVAHMSLLLKIIGHELKECLHPCVLRVMAVYYLCYMVRCGLYTLHTGTLTIVDQAWVP